MPIFHHTCFIHVLYSMHDHRLHVHVKSYVHQNEYNYIYIIYSHLL